MPKITRQCIDKIKSNVDILDVVSPYVTLKRCGSSWRGLSPFGQEKTPSFFVIPAKSMFKCFSSGYAGDIFRFIQLKENVSFGEAVEMVARKFNITLEYERADRTDIDEGFTRKDIFEINEISNEYFVRNFNSSAGNAVSVREYWQNERNFSLDFASMYSIGLAPDNEAELLKILVEKNFSVDALKNCGLFYFKDGESNIFRFKLRMHARMTIAIRDIQDRIVGFTARFVPGVTPEDEFSGAKYINTPETSIFHKGNLLFGISHARKYVDSVDEFWLVEGQIDCLRCWSVGLNTAVAPQGTAITDAQLSILRRYTANINCLLDGDEAGFKAVDRIIPMAFKAGLNLNIMLLNNGDDPDNFFRSNSAEKINILRDNSISSIEFLMRRFLPDVENVSGRQKADSLQKIYAAILNSDSAVVQESCLNELAELSKSDRRAIAADFKTFSDRLKFNEPMPIKFNVECNSISKVSKKILSAEAQLLSIILSKPKLAMSIASILSCDWLLEKPDKTVLLLEKIINEIQAGMWEGSSSIDIAFNDESDKNLLYRLMVDFEEPDSLEGEINQCIKKIYTNYVRNQILTIDKQITKNSIDRESLKILQTERLRLREKLLSQPNIKLGNF